jgi:hypothetical protein
MAEQHGIHSFISSRGEYFGVVDKPGDVVLRAFEVSIQADILE